MSEKSLSIRIKIGNNEIEISGSPSNISKMLDDLPKIVDKVSTSFSTAKLVSSITSISKQKTKPPEERFPTISTQIGISCPEAITAILSTKWGRKKPRNLGEILEAMKVNAMHYPSSTLSGVLTWLVKRGKLRRWKTDEGYVYIISEQS